MRLTANVPYSTGAVSDQVKVKKAAKAVPKVLETELGIKYIELKKGSGAFPTPNDYVIINYRCGMCSTTSYRNVYEGPQFDYYI
jgi:FKBP-type peptidyl-prolyl cis-trans isomerase